MKNLPSKIKDIELIKTSFYWALLKKSSGKN